MDNRQNNRTDPTPDRDPLDNRLEGRSSVPNDLPDSERDKDELRTEETYIDLPDVKDIPGQEFVHTANTGIIGDTTISSDDEEGVGVFDLDDSEDLTMGTDADVTPGERAALRDSNYMPTPDEDRLREARMDNVDFQKEPLNEKGFGEQSSGRDLDVPGSTDETRTTSIGQGDEENKYYSLGSADNDNVTEGTP
jgi:hypothetical protein